METNISFINLTDIAVAVLIVLGILGGARRGLSGELTRLISIIVAFIVAWKTFPLGADWLSQRVELSSRDLNWVSFLGIAAIAYSILSIIRLLLRLLLSFKFKGKVELLGGGLFGFCRALVFCVVILFGAALLPSEPVQQKLNASYSGRAVISYILPLYTDWAEDNPEFQLPDIEPVGDVELETAPWDEYLGPLVEDIVTGKETEE